MKHTTHSIIAGMALTTLASTATAQRPDLESPGGYGGNLGQTTRFDSEFNPAVSFVIDVIGEYTGESGGGEDGLDLNLRRIDLLVADWIDPNAFAWITLAYEESEFELDEAAIEYIGLPNRNMLRAGRFFVDFGKQMQAHIEELRTIERPLVLRDFLGEELAGDGVQWDYWHGVGDTTMLRYSFAAFGSLAGGHGHGEEDPEPEVIVPSRKQLDEMNFTARVTGLTEVGENGQLQLGGSGRVIPEFAFEYDPSDLTQAGYSNSVFGLDATYGWQSDTGIRNFSTGFEYLWNTGDLEAELNDAGTPADPTDDTFDVANGTRNGYYGFVDYGWSQRSSSGVQYSRRQASHIDKAERGELDLYYTHHLSEFLRLRFGLTFASDEAGPDSTRFAIQLTSFVGPHGHGMSW